jgi:iron complex outermembrane recepter protein
MRAFLYSICLFISFSVSAQNGHISGKIETVDGKPAPFVNILLTKTRKGTSSNNDGTFEIRNVPAGKYVLAVSAVGMHTKEVETEVFAGETTTLAPIILNESEQELQEITIQEQRGYHDDKLSNSLRLSTPLIETPQNIQVVTKQLLDNQQVFDILDGVTRNVSGAQRVEHWDNYARINMRGSQITAFRNGINVQMPWGPLAEDMSMVENIEFVKGPAGFMFSSGEPGGFYNVVTKKPTGNSKGEVSLSTGSFQYNRATLDLDGKLTSDGKLLYRFNAMGNLKNSHRDFEFNNRFSIVPVVKYLFNDRTSVTLEYTYQFSQMSAIGSNYAFSPGKYGDLPISFTTAEPNLDPTEIKDRSVLAILEHKINEDWKLTGQLAYFNYEQIGQSIWPWSVAQDGTMQRAASIWDALGINRAAQFFINGKVRTGAIEHKILSGLDVSFKDYYADWSQGGPIGDATFNIYAPEYRVVSGSELPKYDRSRTIRERGVQYGQSYSAFYLQDEISLLENKLRLTLAGRYTSAKALNPYSDLKTKDDSKITPRVGLSYSVTPSTSVYAVYDQTFSPNMGIDYNKKSFDPMTGTNIEAGVKKDLLNGTWNIGVSAFQITKENTLVDDIDNLDEQTKRPIYSKAIQTQTKGVELDIRGEIVKNLDLIFNYSYTDATVTKDVKDEYEGVAVPGTNKHNNNLWLTYRLDKTALRGLGFSLGYQYQVDRSSWFVFDGTEQSLPDYFRLDGGISWTRDKISLALNVNNILDEYLYSGAPYDFDYDGTNESFYWQTEAPLNYRLTAAYRF